MSNSNSNGGRRRSLANLGGNMLQSTLAAFVPPKLAHSGSSGEPHAATAQTVTSARPDTAAQTLAAAKPPRPKRPVDSVSGPTGGGGGQVVQEATVQTAAVTCAATSAGAPVSGPSSSAARQVAELMQLADKLLPAAESPQAGTQEQQPTLRDALKESWAGKSYYERLESIVAGSPAPKRQRATTSLANASPLSRAALAAAALDDAGEEDVIVLDAAPAPMHVSEPMIPAPRPDKPLQATAAKTAAAPPHNDKEKNALEKAVADARAELEAAKRQAVADKAEIAAMRGAHAEAIAALTASRADVSRLSEELSSTKAQLGVLQTAVQAALRQTADTVSSLAAAAGAKFRQ